MATYVYETIPAKAGEPVRRFEVKQSMKEAPLEKHPETGEPVRRVISGGIGFITGAREATRAPASPDGGGCGHGSCGCGHNH